MSLFQEIRDKLFFIAGQCVIEDEEMLFETAEKIKEITQRLEIPYIFKSSYDKANRTSINSYRGPGLEKGLKMLSEVKKRLNIKISTDVHSINDVEKVAKVADIIQIPAFLCRQTDLLLAAARSGRIVNVKKGQFLSPESVKFIIEKLESAGCKEILITERGTSFGYGQLVVDFAGIPVMKRFGYPVVFDATHSVQRPPTGDSITGGKREVIPNLLYAAISAGVDGVYMEVHPEPEKALCDKDSQFQLNKLHKILNKAKQLYQIIR